MNLYVAQLGACQRKVLDALHAEMDKRQLAKGVEWITNERHAATVAANEYATAIGRPTITVEQVERVEQRAIGHVDYAWKLALYVAELAVGA